MFSTRPAMRARDWVRNLSLAGKIIAVIMGVSSAALLLACLALVALRQHDRAHRPDARHRHARRRGRRDQHRRGVVQRRQGRHRDARRRRRQQERPDGRDPPQRRGVRPLRSPARTPPAISILTRVEPDLVRAPRAVFTFERRLAAAGAPDPARRRADRRRLHRVGPRRAPRPAAAPDQHHRRRPVRRAGGGLRPVVAAAAADLEPDPAADRGHPRRLARQQLRHPRREDRPATRSAC